MGWEVYKTFTSAVGNSVDTINVLVSILQDDPMKRPGFSVSINSIHNGEPKRNIHYKIVENADFLPTLTKLIADARSAIKTRISEYEDELQLRNQKAEQERQRAIAGKRGGDPKAGSGLSRFKNKHKSA